MTTISSAESPENVLLVDDTPDNLRVLHQTLAGQGYRLLVARNGPDALEIVHKAQPELVLLDIMMPGMDGYEVCRVLKEDSSTAGIPVIFLSALEDVRDKVRGFSLGAVDYITKPFQGAEVIARVGTHLKIHRLERALDQRNRELEGENRRILQSMGEGLLSVDREGTIRFANPAAIGMTGWSESALVGEKVQVLWVDGQTVDRLPSSDPLGPVLHEGVETQGNQLNFVRRDGSLFAVEYTGTPVLDGGQRTGAVLVFRDISRRREAEEGLQRAHEDLMTTHRELQQAQERLIQAAKLESVGRLAAGVAHEVKNPLAIIQLGLDFLEGGGELAPAALEVVADMDGAIHRADSVIKGLLDFSRSEAPKVAVEDLNAVIREAIRLVNHELSGHDIELRDELAPEALNVAVDHAKMGQVFINLFMNAIQAMGMHGVLEVRSRRQELDEAVPVDPELAGRLPAAGAVAVVEVSDTGPGLDSDKADKVFDPFFTTKPAGQGTGLGLSVTRTIVRQHGASLTLRNRVDRNGAIATLVFQTERERS